MSWKWYELFVFSILRTNWRFVQCATLPLTIHSRHRLQHGKTIRAREAIAENWLKKTYLKKNFILILKSSYLTICQMMDVERVTPVISRLQNNYFIIFQLLVILELLDESKHYHSVTRIVCSDSVAPWTLVGFTHSSCTAITFKFSFFAMSNACAVLPYYYYY